MIEIAITPNRGDCLGVRGVARDLAAAGYGQSETAGFQRCGWRFSSSLVWHIDDSAKRICAADIGAECFPALKMAIRLHGWQTG